MASYGVVGYLEGLSEDSSGDVNDGLADEVAVGVASVAI